MRFTDQIRRSECPITGIIVKHLRTTPKVTTFLPPNQIHLLKKGAVMFVLSALVCGQRSEQFRGNTLPTISLTRQAIDNSSSSKNQSLDWLFGPKQARSGELYVASSDEIFDRVAARLLQSEAHETDLHLKSDYRQSFICLSLARKGNTEPFLVSSYQMYGLHPDKVFSKIMANRRERLGREFGQWWTPEGVLLPDVEVPKKPNELASGELSGRILPKDFYLTTSHNCDDPLAVNGTGDATGDGTSSELPGSTSPASLPMKGRTA